MPAVSQDPTMERPDIDRIFGIVRRRHLQFLIPLFLGWLAVWGASWVLPPRYKSSTTILVEQPSMPNDYVMPNVSDDWQTRLQSITEQILSQTRLLTIVNRLHLYGDMQNGATADDKVDQMKKDIKIDLTRDPSRSNISAFTISYSAGDPNVAQRVTGELASLFITENTKVRQQESQGTTDFLEQQLVDARANLAAQEAKVREFEAQHEGNLPTEEQSNLAILTGLQTQLQNEQDAVNTAKQQKAYQEAMLEQAKATASKVRVFSPNGTGEPGAVDLATIDQQLDKLRAELVDLSSRYTDEYPDVQTLKSQIAKTEAIRASLVAAAKAKSSDPKAADAGDVELTGAALQLQSELKSTELEITNRENAIAQLKTRIGGYEGRLNLQPGTAQQLADLTRGYDQSQQNYNALLKKQQDSAMATSMEQLQQGERFTVLDPPDLPKKPDFPNRLKFCAMGLVAGLALGFVVAAGFEFMDDRMHSGKQIKAMLPMVVISEVPEVSTASDQRNRKRSLTWGWVATAIVAVAIVAGSVFSFLNS
jgi:polysaccharide biosynthesis transport protein